MSGLFDKKTVKTNRRQERTIKEQSEKKKVRIIAISVVSVFVVLFAGALFINSKYLRREVPAITVGGTGFSAAEFNYYFNEAYQQYKNNITNYLGEEYASYVLPSSDKALSKQTYNEETGESWADFIAGYTVDRLKELVQLNDAAKAEGYTMPADEVASMQEEIDYLNSQALMTGVKFDTFLQNYIAADLSGDVLGKIMRYVYTASSYSLFKYNSFTYDEQQLKTYYSENRDNLDSYTFRYFEVAAEVINESDFEATEDYTAANDAAIAAARSTAAEIVAGITDEAGYILAAREFDAEIYEKDSSTLLSQPGQSLVDNSFAAASWLMDAARQQGDIGTVDSTTGAYVMYFVGRDNNEYSMTKMRQILIMPEEVEAHTHEAGEEHVEGDDAEYQEALAAAELVAQESANTALAVFIERGATEEALLGMIDEGYSEDTTEGGYYEGISRDASKMKMVPEIEEWLFAPERVYGEYKLIKSEDYGYHLVFFMGHHDGLYCDYLAESKLREGDFAAWTENLPKVESVKRHWAYNLVSN